MPSSPDFIVWQDVYADAQATMEFCRSLFERLASLIPRLQDWTRYVVFHPGASLDELFTWAREMGADGIFVGGPRRWKRAVGAEIVGRAHEVGYRIHIGNPGGVDGLTWAYRLDADSVDTTTIVQNGYWHYLDRLEEVTEETSDTPATRGGAPTSRPRSGGGRRWLPSSDSLADEYAH